MLTVALIKLAKILKLKWKYSLVKERTIATFLIKKIMVLFQLTWSYRYWYSQRCSVFAFLKNIWTHWSEYLLWPPLLQTRYWPHWSDVTSHNVCWYGVPFMDKGAVRSLMLLMTCCFLLFFQANPTNAQSDSCLKSMQAMTRR